jgi:glycosyltransferase involved in cell wall biosynthesis
MNRWSWAEMPRMTRCLKECAPDAVLMIYIGWVYHYEFMPTYAASLAKWALPGVPFVTRFENAMGADYRHTSRFSRYYRKWMEFRYGRDGNDFCYGTLLRDSSRIIVLSERHRRILSQVSPLADQKCVLIPPPSNMAVTATAPARCRAEMRRKYGLPDDTFVISYLGYLHAGKGLDTLLRAFQQVAQERADVRLMLMGGTIDSASGNPTTYVQELQTLARQLGIADKLLWTGAYSGISDEASQLLTSSDLCVLPFANGVNLNNSSFASVATHALPVITTRSLETEEQFVHADNVYLCAPQDPAALAGAMRTLLADAALRQRLSSGIERMTAEWFSWDRALDKTLAACRPEGWQAAAELPVKSGEVSYATS